MRLCREIRPGRNGSRIPKRVISAIEDEAHEVETFLDDYDARSNKTFATLTEFVACARGFAEIDRTIQHVLMRFPSYHAEQSAFDDEFCKETERTLAFADSSLRKLLEATVREAASAIGREFPRSPNRRTEPPERGRRFLLRHDIDELAAMNDREKIAELASLYIAHKHALDKLSECRRIDDVPAMRQYVLEVSDEEQCRFFQTRIHNLQSKYDTFVKATEAEQRDPDLKRFRGYVSIALHLIESMTQLVHFYGRHENDIRAEQVKNRIAALIDKDEVLDRALNYCLFYTHAYLNEGLPLAEQIVKRYTSQERLELELPRGRAHPHSSGLAHRRGREAPWHAGEDHDRIRDTLCRLRSRRADGGRQRQRGIQDRVRGRHDASAGPAPALRAPARRRRPRAIPSPTFLPQTTETGVLMWIGVISNTEGYVSPELAVGAPRRRLHRSLRRHRIVGGRRGALEDRACHRSASDRTTIPRSSPSSACSRSPLAATKVYTVHKLGDPLDLPQGIKREIQKADPRIVLFGGIAPFNDRLDGSSSSAPAPPAARSRAPGAALEWWRSTASPFAARSSR